MTSVLTDTHSRSGRRALRLGLLAAAAVAVVCLGLALAGPAAASTNSGWVRHQVDADSCWDLQTRDVDGNGENDDVWLDANNDCRWETHIWLWWSSYGRRFASMTFDTNADGHWDIWYADNAQIPDWTIVYTDANADGYYDSWTQIKKSTSAAPQSDRAAREAAEQRARDAVVQALAREQYRKMLTNLSIVGRLG